MPFFFSLEQLAAIPQFADLGLLFRSSPKPVELTESETEYVVNCVKHVFNDHIVFQVSMANGETILRGRLLMKAGALQTNIFLLLSSLCHVTHVFKIVSYRVIMHVCSGI